MEKMKKEIYVNGYIRADGTEVEGYYRTIDVADDSYSLSGLASENGSTASTSSFEPEIEWVQLPLPEETVDVGSPVLYGSVEENVDYTDNPNEEESSGVSDSVIQGAIDNVISGIETSDGVITDTILKNIDPLSEMLDAAVVQSQRNEQNHLEALVKPTNQANYNKNYQNYLKIRQKNIDLSDNLKRLKYGIAHKNANIIVESLQNYQSNFVEVSNKNRIERPLARPEGMQLSNYVNTAYNTIKQHPGIDLITPGKRVPFLDKLISQAKYDISQGLKSGVDLGMWGTNGFKYGGKIDDAKEMWKASSHDFKRSKDYVERNGALISSINDLPDKEFQAVIRNKVQQQMGVNDSIGMVFRSDSNLAKQIAKSPEMKELFLKHKDELLNGQVVKGESTYFGSNKNLALALGHADIYYSYIGQDGNMYAIVGDTYDMNKNDPDWKVRIARAVQDLGAMRTYYSLVIVKIPYVQLKKWVTK